MTPEKVKSFVDGCMLSQYCLGDLRTDYIEISRRMNYTSTMSEQAFSNVMTFPSPLGEGGNCELSLIATDDFAKSQIYNPDQSESSVIMFTRYQRKSMKW